MTRLRWLLLFTCLLPVACAALACGADDPTAATPDGSQPGSEASAPSTDASSDAVRLEDGAPSPDGGSARDAAVTPRPPPGSFMGYCTGDGGNSCDPGLTCLHEFMGRDGGGFGGCSQAFCTHPCTAGCAAPAIGCNDDFGLCEAPSCLDP